ncbi:hypothetical protein RN001_005175 [Aquatica leii]|uniref:C2H2-type domain-containing protein n=1 Tax=Aquatica leii TaxID=1421715 RepID=A0AAN7PJG5_9COLE|nr:hypothetical protein RN001_005175 [Aquatica leii]
MPLLQESTPKTDILSGRDQIKVETEEPTSLKNPLTSVAFPSFPNSAMFTPSQILMASQLMAASGLGLPANPAFFHPGLFAAAWPTNSPPSPPMSTEQLSPALKSRKNNNNNNVVSSSSTDTKISRRKTSRKLEEEVPLSSPTSSSSPPSSNGEVINKDANRDRQFTYSNQLKAHLLIHTNEKPFTCDRCHSRFRRRHHLLHHKCGALDKDASSEISDEHDDDIRTRRILEPIVTLPLQVSFPEQTEPEDLSMSTGLHSHSSGDSPLSRSPSSREDIDEDDIEPDDSAALFLQKRLPPHS